MRAPRSTAGLGTSVGPVARGEVPGARRRELGDCLGLCLGYGDPWFADLIERAGRILADAAASPAKVLVFGSHARGEAETGSDLDFLVIEREVVNRAHEMVRLRDALPALGVPVDVIVVTEAQADKWSRVRGTMVWMALDQGRVVAES